MEFQNPWHIFHAEVMWNAYHFNVNLHLIIIITVICRYVKDFTQLDTCHFHAISVMKYFLVLIVNTSITLARKMDKTVQWPTNF